MTHFFWFCNLFWCFYYFVFLFCVFICVFILCFYLCIILCFYLCVFILCFYLCVFILCFYLSHKLFWLIYFIFFLDQNQLLEYEMLEDSKRISVLKQLYSLIRPSFLKSKIAFALGLYSELVEDDMKTAEQLFFESLYILDDCPKVVSFISFLWIFFFFFFLFARVTLLTALCQFLIVFRNYFSKITQKNFFFFQFPSLCPVISELGTNILLRYGEVLLNNYKYMYSVLCYEAAVLSFQIRKRDGKSKSNFRQSNMSIKYVKKKKTKKRLYHTFIKGRDNYKGYPIVLFHFFLKKDFFIIFFIFQIPIRQRWHEKGNRVVQ